MCGRYALTTDTDDLLGLFGAEPDRDPVYGGDAPRPRYNIAPTTENPVVRLRDDAGTPAHRVLTVMRWGLVPSWAKDPSTGNRMFNARAESAATTGAFSNALRRRRVLVPVSGFYEWHKLGTGRGAPKQAYWITPGTEAAGQVMALAGLWEYWRQGEQKVLSYTILTTEAVGPMREIHERMPLILPAQDWASWLDPDTAGQVVTDLLRPADPVLVDRLEFRPVSAAVGNVNNDSPDLLERVSPQDDHGQGTLL